MWPHQHLQVCPRTWSDDGLLQIHFHAFIDGYESFMVSLDRLHFKGVRPNASNMNINGHSRGANTAKNRGRYYCAAPTTGQLRFSCTKMPFVDYPIPPDYITSLWASGKMDNASAKGEYVKCKVNVKNNVGNLFFQESMAKTVRLEATRLEVLEVLEKVRKPRRYIAIVEDTWFKGFSAICLRYKFLILHGPSMTGKTHYARSFYGATATLELNCRNCPEPDFRTLDPEVHKLVILDECRLSSVLLSKKVIQAGPMMAAMGSSQTHCHAYNVFPFRVRFVVCSNTYAKEMEVLRLEDPGEAEWIDANAYAVHVTEPLWVT